MTKTPPAIHSDPQIMGGEPVFVGTRVLVRSLFEYLEAGDSLAMAFAKRLRTLEALS